MCRVLCVCVCVFVCVLGGGAGYVAVGVGVDVGVHVHMCLCVHLIKAAIRGLFIFISKANPHKALCIRHCV